MLGCQRRMVAQEAQKFHRTRRLKPIAILCRGVAMENSLVILKVKAHDAQVFHITVDNRWAADNAQHNVGRDIIAE